VKTLKIPEATIIRLSVYSRYLAQIKRKGVVTISSGEIARGVGVSSAQVLSLQVQNITRQIIKGENNA
jgi:redox-sensing transcriptional repressor